ncbi:transcriptional regulator [Hominisplanchenecus murintestinalis]|uniref:Transcriptional regulator n=1 Tax=Hominisplanchenecus murintestinalis TaxID=2941517 RepID=A0AC61QZC2_9FIRM|nr:transcriptional regulator [Hominisplanchenecus murintestinalis]
MSTNYRTVLCCKCDIIEADSLFGIERHCMKKMKYQPKGDCNMAQDLKYHSMVRMYRIQSGLRQEDLARKVDVSRRTIITAESDNCNLSLATALRLAAFFQRTVDELFVKEEG